MQIYTVTLTGTAQIIVPQDAVIQRNVSFQTLVIGNPSTTAVLYVGDSTVSATKGIPIPAGTNLVLPTALLTQNLNGWYVFGTAAQTATIMILE